MVDNKYDIVGIGNSIVDVITDVEDQFLNEHELRKGLMSLVDLDGIKNISEKIDIKKTVSGGSVANSIVALAQNNMKTAFIGKVGIDEVGNAFVDGLNKENVFFANVPQSDESETGRCLVMVTPDAQRTMSTYLGISQKLNSDDVNEDVISQSKITYLEGYLWDLDDAQVAIKKATKVAKENNKIVAFSVSDVFCIERFKESFLSLINEEADIILS
jgi:sugar/nucleoside kinase (ribokinase family)